VIQLVLVAIVLRHLARFGRAFPWVAALAAFFAVRGVDRIYVALAGREPNVLAYTTDALVLLALVLLLIGIERMVVGLRLAQDEAARRQSEYDRALSDYRTLARHRLANPITAIRGGVATLRDVRELDQREARAVLEMMEQEALRLERIALDPRPQSPEETALRPRPEI
jgi:signal transduction histidine kinase